MSLINTDKAIAYVEEQKKDLDKVIQMYDELLVKFNTVNGKQNTKQALTDAGFTDEQINTFIGIVMRTVD